jgi:hypothetical protein
MPKETRPYHLEDEQQQRIKDCLRKAGLNLSSDKLEVLTRGIEQSMDLFMPHSRTDTFREAHDQLAQLWELSHDDDPKTGVIRGRIERLPKRAVEYLERRSPQICRSLFPDDLRTQKFQDWARTACTAKLTKALQVITGEGAKVTEGRSRGAGRRSAAPLGAPV